MATEPSIDLLIVGSGPVGMTAAIEAQRMGLSCRIVDRKERRRTNDSRAVVVHPRMLELLKAHPGLVRKIEEAADELPCGNIEFAEEKETITVTREEQRFGDTEYPSLYFLPQYRTERFLEEKLQEGGGRVEYGVAFEGLTQTEDGVTARVKPVGGDGEEENITARYVIGADGGRSKVRDSIGVALERISSSVYFILSDMKLEENSPSKKLPGAHIVLTKDGPCVMLPLTGDNDRGEYIRLFMQAPDGISKDDVTLDKDFFEKQILEMTGKEFRVELGEWQAFFEITHGVSDSYRRGNVFLAGDAAHVHSPVGGQGMNYGIWDAVSLVSKIAWAKRVRGERPAAAGARDGILESYAAERRALGEALVSRVKLATSALTTTNRGLQRLRNFLMRRLVPLARGDLMRTAGQLDLRYDPSQSRFILPAPTSWSFASRGYICRPGQRLPNLVLDDGSRLYDRVGRERHTWICVSATEPPEQAGDRRVCVTPAKEQASVPAISEDVLARPQAVLVRPDLFVAAVGESLEELQDAVKKVFGEECYTTM